MFPMLWRLFCWLSCMAGLVWQIYYISDQYFQYPSVTMVTLSRQSRYFPPVLTFCHRRAHIIPELRTTTPRDFFEATPTIEEITKKFDIHDPNSYVVNEYRSPGDYGKFAKIEKSVKMSYLCYSIRFHQNISFPVYYLTNSYVVPKFYIFYSNGSAFVNCNYTFFFLNSPAEGFFGKAETFTENFRYIIDNSTGRGAANLVTMSYSAYSSHRLPAPYQSRCLNYKDLGFESKKHCFDSCLTKKSIEQLGKIPFSVMVGEPLDIPFVHYDEDVRNKTFFRKLQSIEKECHQKCNRKNCLKQIFVPKVITACTSDTPSIEFYMTNSPEIVTTSIPHINAIEYVTYVLSCISFWISFSPLVFFQSKMVTKFFRTCKVKPKKVKKKCNCACKQLRQQVEFLMSQTRRITFTGLR